MWSKGAAVRVFSIPVTVRILFDFFRPDSRIEDARVSGDTALSSPCWDLLALMRRVVNYHSSWVGQRQVELFDTSGLPDYSAGLGVDPVGGALGGLKFLLIFESCIVSLRNENYRFLVKSTMVKVTVAPAGGIGISRYGDISVTHEDLLVLEFQVTKMDRVEVQLVDPRIPESQFIYDMY
ncbi:hypothetical protein F511_30595 [Dorcoceras hygrometricum]|uniref:Uncharacterized protein n=1 Tax=Dorcoceras hygrometricum TaxID=472368 RepID=A0A2Z7D7E3_9LAMI|nr:hypothetical protein F511_30595 [Dorcoceras hygrometricum]